MNSQYLMNCEVRIVLEKINKYKTVNDRGEIVTGSLVYVNAQYMVGEIKNNKASLMNIKNSQIVGEMNMSELKKV
nr:MAG TPA: hypothetical protein [Caudoviricetes sp.]